LVGICFSARRTRAMIPIHTSALFIMEFKVPPGGNSPPISSLTCIGSTGS